MPSKGRDFYSTHTWRKIRLQVLERDQYQCQIRSKRCTQLATQVDHIVPWTKGGAKFDPNNLRASCKNCNLGRIDRTRGDVARVGGIEFAHPVFETFRAPRSGDFTAVPVYGYRRLTTVPEAQVLARFDAFFNTGETIAPHLAHRLAAILN